MDSAKDALINIYIHAPKRIRKHADPLVRAGARFAKANSGRAERGREQLRELVMGKRKDKK